MHSTSLRARALVSFVAIAAAAVVAVGPARADIKLEARVLDSPPPPKADMPKAPPELELTVIGASALDLGVYSLKQTDKNLEAIKAIKLTPYVEGHEPIGIVIVVEGDAHYLGVSQMLEGVTGALTSLAAAGPPGSQAVVIMYAADAEVVQSALPLSELPGVKLSPRTSDGPKAQRNLAAGLKLALGELDKLTTKRKALVVIGDAVDGAGAASASGPIRDIGKKLVEKNVPAAAFIYQVNSSEFGQPDTPMKMNPQTKVLEPDIDMEAVLLKEYQSKRKQAVEDAKFLTSDRASVVSSKTGFAGAADSFVTELADRFYLRFPGYDLKAKAGLTWDGKAHPLSLRVEGNDFAAIEVTLAPSWSPPGGGSSAWMFIVIPLAVIGVGAGVFMVMKKKKAPPELPKPALPPGVLAGGVPGAAPAAGTAGAALQSKPQKTMFMQAANDDVFPVVGWLVFLNGPQRFKTHKLPMTGITKIGTGKESDIVIDDGFMSTNHALVMTTPDGFRFEDANSRNGSLVNNVRVKGQELNDNDVITLGKTQLKFKATI